MFATDYLEDDYRKPYTKWKADPSPESNASFLKTIHPVIEKAVQAHVGAPNPVLMSKARRMSLQAMRNYDPKRSRLQTHLFNQLQGLKRVNRSQTQILKVPERIQLDRYHLENHKQDFIDRYGREPSDQDLADHSGFSAKRIKRVGQYNPAVAEGTLEASNPDQMIFGSSQSPMQARLSMWQQLVMDDLSPVDRYVMEHTLKGTPNQLIASKLNRSPGLISQRKKFIQGLLDKEDSMSGML